MLRFTKLYFIPAILYFTLACSTSGELDDLIPEDTYIDLLTELHLLSALENTYPDSTLREDGFEQVLLKYNITAEAFEDSHEYYLQDVQGQRGRLDEANRRLDEEFSRINNIANELQEERRRINREANEGIIDTLDYSDHPGYMDDSD